MLKRLTKISEETIHQNPWWIYKHDKYEKQNGEIGDYYYAETTGSVLVVPVLDDDRIILNLQYRYLSDKQSIEFPGGSIKSNESVIEAVERKLREQTGFKAKEIIKMGVFESANEFCKNSVHVFLAKISEKQKQILDDNSETELMYRNPEDIERMIKNNEIFCGDTMAVWSLVRNYFL